MSVWNPPLSPFKLVQEPYFGDEWKILVCCQLLNMTTHVQVRKVLHKLFRKYPEPTFMALAKENELKDLLRPLGFYNKRSKALIRFSNEYLTKKWKTAKDLYGIGKYGDDAWHIFCVGDWENVEPNDQALNKYHDWLWERENA
jgi:methyl-CpG-binding domain protein 4